MKLAHYNIATYLILIIVLYLLLNHLFKKLEEKKYKAWALPSVFSIIAGLLFLINQFCWHWPVINPFIIDVPKIDGTYKGYVEIAHLDTTLKEKAPVEVVIRQTGCTTSLDLRSKGGSHSTSIIADVVKTNEVWYLYTYYRNENYIKPENRNRFDGGCKAEISVDGDTTRIVGQFFNDETRKTYGTINLKKAN